MHKEKVSRREIGVFTAVKQVPRSHKILPLSSSSTAAQPRPPYSRRPINYQQLDSLGHGMKVSLQVVFVLQYVDSLPTGSVCYMLTGSAGGNSEPQKQTTLQKTTSWKCCCALPHVLTCRTGSSVCFYELNMAQTYSLPAVLKLFVSYQVPASPPTNQPIHL